MSEGFLSLVLIISSIAVRIARVISVPPFALTRATYSSNLMTSRPRVRLLIFIGGYGILSKKRKMNVRLSLAALWASAIATAFAHTILSPIMLPLLSNKTWKGPAPSCTILR